MPDRFVLDTTALLAGLDFEGEVYVPARVLEEARRKGVDPRTELLLEAKARVLDPGEGERERVRRAARETGDGTALSPVDVDVLALALQLEAAILTDDYAIQNVASHLRLPYRPAVLPGIRRALRWTHRCRGCGRYWVQDREVCPVCGSEVRRVRRR